MDPNDINDQFLEKFLKSMPAWESADAFGVDLLKLTHGNDILLNKIESITRSMLMDSQESATILTTHEDNDEAEYDRSLNLLQQRIQKGQDVYAMIEPDQPWVKCKLVVIFQRPRHYRKYPVICFKIKLPPDYTQIRDVHKLAVAWDQNHGRGLRPAKRVIAGPDNEKLLPGFIGNVPNQRSKFRYLVHHDNGSAGYYQSEQVYPIVCQSSQPWNDMRIIGTDQTTESTTNIQNVMASYPRRLYVNVNIGNSLHILRDGKTQEATAVSIDEDILHLRYEDGTEESVYRGSSRLMRDCDRTTKNVNHLDHFHTVIIINMNNYEKAGKLALGLDCQGNLLIKSNNTARKSTASRQEAIPRIDIRLDNEDVPDLREIEILTGALLDQSKSHRCSPECLNIEGVKTEISVIDMIAEFRHMSDLKVPLLLGWRRMLRKIKNYGKVKVAIVYESPCRKLFVQPHYIRKHLSDVNSQLDIDYFSFDRRVELNTTGTTFKAVHYDENIAIGSDGVCLENKQVSLVNQYDFERLPTDFTYLNSSVPHPNLAAKGFSFHPEFKSGCDCDGDCYQRATCKCHILNEEMSGINAHLRGTVSDKCQYSHKRLTDRVITGIFECNSYCSCSSKCHNRVVQNGIRYRLQLQKFPRKGWGVITLDDIPQGAFVCTYAAELLDDADQYGDSDMYYADLDYISINEERKGLAEDFDEGIALDVQKRSSSDSDEDSYMPRSDKSRSSSRSSRPHANYRKIHNILGSHDYTLDARMRGNMGRFLNHSCDPNSYAQNVFIDTHDLRFPVVSFFSNDTIKALDEITWDYGYKMGAIAGRQLNCHCGKPNCRGRIL